MKKPRQFPEPSVNYGIGKRMGNFPLALQDFARKVQEELNRISKTENIQNGLRVAIADPNAPIIRKMDLPKGAMLLWVADGHTQKPTDAGQKAVEIAMEAHNIEVHPENTDLYRVRKKTRRKKADEPKE